MLLCSRVALSSIEFVAMVSGCVPVLYIRRIKGWLLLQITWFSLYCGLMLSISAFSIDILLPAFPGLSDSTGATSQQVQLTIPVYLFAMGLAHPFFGALSDRAGRKPGIYLGLAIFISGTVVCLLSTSLLQLLVGRFLQGFGAAAAAVICRAMVRDLYSGSALAQNMAIVSMFFAIGPVLAPLIGYLIFESVGWRGIFVFLVLFVLAMGIATYKQPETLAVEFRRKAGWREIIENFALIFKHPQSRYFIWLGIASTCLIVTFLEHAQVLYAQLGADSKRFAYLFAFSSAGIILGQVFNYKLIHRFGAIGAARTASVVVSVTAGLIMCFVYSGMLTDRLLTLLMLAFHTCFLVIHANIVSLMLDPHRERAGAAAAVFGFTGYMAGSLLAALVTVIAQEELGRWSVCFFVTSLVIAVGLFRWRQPLISS